MDAQPVPRQQFDSSSRVTTLAVRQWEDDVRALLDWTDDKCDQPPAIVRVIRRLRLLVG